jgi:hypothetical protein
MQRQIEAGDKDLAGAAGRAPPIHQDFEQEAAEAAESMANDIGHVSA